MLHYFNNAFLTMKNQTFSSLLFDVWQTYITRPIVVACLLVVSLCAAQTASAQCLSVLNANTNGQSTFTVNITNTCGIALKPSDLATVSVISPCGVSASDKFTLDIYDASQANVVYTVQTTTPYNAATSAFDFSAVPTSALIGQSRIVKLTYLKLTAGTYVTNSSILGVVTFKDTAAPTFVCPADKTIECYEDTSVVNTGTITSIVDCAGAANVTVTHNTALATVNFCTNPIFVIYNRTFVIADAANNSSTCVQKIYIRKGVLADFAYPGNVELTTVYPTCNYTNLSPNGINSTPTFKGLPIVFGGSNPTQKAYCNIVMIFADAAPTALCGIGTSRTRTYTTVDFCTLPFPTTVTTTQVITIVDKQNPTAQPINATNELTYYTGANNTSTSCTVDVNLPSVSATDCSSLTYKITGPNAICVNANGTGSTPIPLVAAATPYLFEYKVTDACSNATQQLLKVNVIDNTAPVAICKQGFNVSLSNYGDAKRAGILFNENSYDNCSGANLGYKVRRLVPAGQAFADDVTFTCADVNQPGIMVALQVTDVAGNVNTCMSTVNVSDKLPPTIAGPVNVTVECTTDLTNLTPFGNAQYYDNCGFNAGQPVYTETKNISNCGTGTIVRNWVVTDKQGFSASTSQTITVVNTKPFNPDPAIVNNPDQITWPANVVALSSVVGCKDPSYFTTTLGGEPIVKSGNSCNLIAKSMSQDVFYVAPGSGCFKIMRTWKIVDWCQHMADPTKGIWSHTQLLTMMDNIPPAFGPGADPVDLTFSTNSTTCSATIKLKIPKATDDCSGTPTVVIESTLPGFDPANPTKAFDVALINKATGDAYTVKYKVIDACGNSINKTVNVFIKDLIKPTPVAIQGFSTTINPSSKDAIIYANNVNNGSYDLCTASNALVFAFDENFTRTSLTFTCDSLGTRAVRLWVKDLAGNKAYTTTYVDVQNNMGACSPTIQMANIAGDVQTEKGDKVQNVSIEMNTTAIVTPFKPYMTNTNGSFMFQNLTQGAYNVKPAKDDDAINGVSTYDLVLMSKHILNQQPLTTPYQMIAADVNKNGKITTADMVELRKLILHVNKSFPNNTSWRFIDKKYVFPTPTNPWAATFPELTTLNVVPQGATADFVGVKIGDLNGNAQANSTMAASSLSDRNRRMWYVSTDDRKAQAGEEVTLRFNGDTGMEGFQFTMKYDAKALSFINATDVDFALLEDGTLTMSSVENKPFSITFKARANTTLSKAIQINSEVTKAEAYNTDNNSVANVALYFNNAQPIAATFELHQNKPNPFRGMTTISFTLPEDSKATLTIYDISGRNIRTVEGEYKRGFNEMIVNDMDATGVLFYRLDTPNNTGTKKMIVLQ